MPSSCLALLSLMSHYLMPTRHPSRRCRLRTFCKEYVASLAKCLLMHVGAGVAAGGGDDDNDGAQVEVEGGAGHLAGKAIAATKMKMINMVMEKSQGVCIICQNSRGGGTNIRRLITSIMTTKLIVVFWITLNSEPCPTTLGKPIANSCAATTAQCSAGGPHTAHVFNGRYGTHKHQLPVLSHSPQHCKAMSSHHFPQVLSCFYVDIFLIKLFQLFHSLMTNLVSRWIEEQRQHHRADEEWNLHFGASFANYVLLL